jgi:quercetin dioxygenase-like cupin family protein
MPAKKGHTIIGQPGDAQTVALGPNRVTFLLSREQTGQKYSLTEFAAAPPPTPSAPVHIHHDADEVVYVLEGEFQFTVEGQTIPATAGSFVLVPKGTPHTVANTGTEGGKILVVLSPPGFEGYWREMSALLAASSGPPDPAQVLALQQRYHMDTGGQARQFTH